MTPLQMKLGLALATVAAAAVVGLWPRKPQPTKAPKPAEAGKAGEQTVNVIVGGEKQQAKVADPPPQKKETAADKKAREEAEAAKKKAEEGE